MTKDNETMEQMELSDEMLESVIGGLTRSQRLGTEKFANFYPARVLVKSESSLAASSTPAALPAKQ